MLPSESALCLGTLTFQITGIAALGAGMWCRGDKPRALHMLIVACVVGLGFLTVLAAVQQSMSALSAGITLTVLLLGAIHPLSHEMHCDPYASIYPPEH